MRGRTNLLALFILFIFAILFIGPINNMMYEAYMSINAPDYIKLLMFGGLAMIFIAPFVFGVRKGGE